MLFTYLLLGGLILLVTPHSVTNKIQLAFAGLFRFPLRLGRSITLSVNTQRGADTSDYRKEVQYQNYIANLEQELEQERRKVEKLSGLRNRRALEGAKLVYADIITATINGLRSELIINRGRLDGLSVGQFVLGDNSIIGTISSAEANTAKVKLITDSASRLEVEIAGVGRVMQGGGGSSAKIQMLSREHKIKTGDKVFARKKPGLLDVPIITGRVRECKVDGEHPLLWDVTVEAACKIELLDGVAVIIMNP
jgi:cell shape-determining protein MreC